MGLEMQRCVRCKATVPYDLFEGDDEVCWVCRQKEEYEARIAAVTEITCKWCGLTKPVSEFYKQEAGKYGRRSGCKTCTRKRDKEVWQVQSTRIREARIEAGEGVPTKRVCKRCGLEKPIGEFYKQVKGSWGYTSSCKPCYNRANYERRKARYEFYKAHYTQKEQG